MLRVPLRLTPIQRKSLKAAKRIAAERVVATSWETATAALVGVTVALEVADSDPDAVEAEAGMVVAEVADEEDESLPLLSTAVALRVPHFWLFLQPSCPSASFGCAAMHCTKVSVQM